MRHEKYQNTPYQAQPDVKDCPGGIRDLHLIGRLAKLGLERMRTTPRPGIAALLARSGVAPAAADLETVGFAIAPRLNAAGRVGEALDAARLLLASDEAEAQELAARLEAANTTRRDLMRTAIAQARAAIGLPDPGVAPGQEALFLLHAPAGTDRKLGKYELQHPEDLQPAQNLEALTANGGRG